MDKRKALGRGLESLLPSRPSTATAPTPAPTPSDPGIAGAREIPLDLIDRNPYQTRGQLDEAALAELAASIKEKGVLQPILVRPLRVTNGDNSNSNSNPRSGATSNAPVTNGDKQTRYQLMAGERRWLASQRAGKLTIPAIVKSASDEQAMEITIIENLQREDLNAIEQARAFERLSREFGLTQELIAVRTGKERATVANFMRLLKLPAMVQSAIEEGTLTQGHGKVLMMLSNEPPEVTVRVAQKAIDEALSVRRLEELITKMMGPSRTSETRTEKPRDPNVRAAEQELQRILGCRVTVKDHGGKGKIILDYANLEEFDRVVEVLGKK
jgi:ParB family chromosome partitioning protein